MPQEKNVTVLLYKVLNENNFEIKLTLTPMLACRYYHFVMEKSKSESKIRQNKSGDNELQVSFDRSTISTKLTIRSFEGEFREKPNWVERIVYREDQIRGESSVEDGYQPGAFEFTVPSKGVWEFAVMAAASEDLAEEPRRSKSCRQRRA